MTMRCAAAPIPGWRRWYTRRWAVPRRCSMRAQRPGHLARRFPPVDAICSVVGADTAVRPVAVPIDCLDGFMEAFYARPEGFPDERVRRATTDVGRPAAA